MRRNGRVQSLTILDFDDRALLAIVDDEADEEGWAATGDIADKVFGSGGSEERRRHATRCIGIRFAWLQRYGVAERSHPHGSWRLTDAGYALLYGSGKTARIEKEAREALDADLLHVAMGVGDRYRKADPITQTMMRRAFIYSTGRK